MYHRKKLLAVRTHLTKEEIKVLKNSDSDLNILMDELKEKFSQSIIYDEKVQVLTLKPNSWTYDKTKQFFGCTDHMIKKAKKVKSELGILGLHRRVRKEGITEDTKAKVLALYQNDEYSRQLPGTSDKVSIAKKVYEQKRLILLNSCAELWIVFKELHPENKIGLTRFTQLRPKWCVSPGSAGTHKVCVCVHHENAKLLAIACGCNYKDLVEILVCDVTDKGCMVHRCENCPGDSALTTYLNSVFEISSDDEEDLDDEELHISFQQWEATDRATIITYSLPVSEFIIYVVENISTFTEHSYLSKCQAAYLRETLNDLPRNKMVVQLDFSENYEFVIQDEIQPYHWTKEYCTVHPVILHVQIDQAVEVKSLCFLSNDLSHDTSFVWALQKIIASYVKREFPHISVLEYFSDGCAGQYKNFKNFLNLTYHLNDFGLIGIWNFFASCHGKSPTDGLGAGVKRKLRNKSLTVGPQDAILTSTKAYEYVTEAMPSIKFFHIDQDEIFTDKTMLEQRYRKGSTVIGTRSFHHFSSEITGTVIYRRTSSDSRPTGTHCFFHSAPAFTAADLPISTYIACSYDDRWWIGTVQRIEDGDIRVNFLHPSGPSKSFYWPARQDICWVPIVDVLSKLTPPDMSTSTGRRYKFSESQIASVHDIFENLPK